jgi:DNA-binding NtrC family response regulator
MDRHKQTRDAPRILVVDDDDQMRLFIEAVLIRAGYVVLLAPGASQALEILKENSIQLVVIDLIMPDKEGLETIIEIRRLYPAIRILAISGGGRAVPYANLKAARQIGANGALAKPFSLQELLDEVARVTDH